MKRNNIHKENLLSVVEKNDCDEILHQINTLHPTAVMASSVYKENAYRAIKTAGLQIPDDISFFAFGDVQWVQLLEITAMAHNLEEIHIAVLARNRYNTNILICIQSIQNQIRRKEHGRSLFCKPKRC